MVSSVVVNLKRYCSRFMDSLPRSALSRSVADRLTQMIFQNSKRVFIPILISSSLCYVLILKSGFITAATVWFGLTILTTALRIFGLSRIVNWHQDDPTDKLFVTSALSLGTGLVCGSILLFFPLVGAFERAMLTAMLISICTGAVLINAGYRPIFLSFVLPVFGTMGLPCTSVGRWYS